VLECVCVSVCVCVYVCVCVCLYHHRDEADGQEDVSDGHHRLISGDGQSHGHGGVRHQNDREHEDEERLGRCLQTCTGNTNIRLHVPHQT